MKCNVIQYIMTKVIQLNIVCIVILYGILIAIQPNVIQYNILNAMHYIFPCNTTQSCTLLCNIKLNVVQCNTIQYTKSNETERIVTQYAKFRYTMLEILFNCYPKKKLRSRSREKVSPFAYSITICVSAFI